MPPTTIGTRLRRIARLVTASDPPTATARDARLAELLLLAQGVPGAICVQRAAQCALGDPLPLLLPPIAATSAPLHRLQHYHRHHRRRLSPREAVQDAQRRRLRADRPAAAGDDNDNGDGDGDGATTDLQAAAAAFIASPSAAEPLIAALAGTTRRLDELRCAQWPDEAVLALWTSRSAAALPRTMLALTLLPRLAALTAPPTRPLLAACIAAAKAQPRAFDRAVLVPLATASRLVPAQGEALARIVKDSDAHDARDDTFSVVIAAMATAAQGDTTWTEAHVVLLQTLLARPTTAIAEPAVLADLVQWIEAATPGLAESKLLGTLLMAVAKRQAQLDHAMLQRLAAVARQLKSFLRSACEAAIRTRLGT